jgi:hypothetical protein
MWVHRPQKQLNERLRKRTKGLQGDLLHLEVKKVEDEHREEVTNQPMTVGQLIRKYPYRFPGSKHSGKLVSLGDAPATELKRRLREMGLTPDDWPALVQHDEILEHLSKTHIVTLPVREVFVSPSRYRDSIDRYLGCTQDEVATKTIGDLIKIDPLNPPNVVDSSYDNGMTYFRSHKRKFIALRQVLIAKGFTPRDGALLKWNPTIPALTKARKILRYYNLSPSESRKFAKIAVAERWVTA